MHETAWGIKEIKTTMWFWGKLQEMRLCKTGLWPPTQFQGDRTSSEKAGSHLEREIFYKEIV